ncbi:Co2+/Mg2+ efflux protein ApaG [Hyphomicrobiales bacterium]|jgi:ApaG protein|nr:Co2+/Mg2+ efflux protein ApaG [Hyphomicrobiales bacterium]MDB4831414.1 Co2+/Mg2+ efflux protein ApaG [Hyphomicrobiales bacterium]MDC0139905.1 Co2+/Mg2+ efflux protein ApaG [Hyphomicrobiales bacterium]MDC3272147.1 Co2+/Mg2+ efflux protein ApaG [Hyphomicrobiales bacterium]|tara:strand:- start:68 stop:460 length:393 start_codon:yes stop_codon:yes gene_type:complete
MNKNIKNDITINVDPVYLEDESEPEEDYFLWAYTINILNKSKEPIQLRSRYWRITDSQGIIHEVSGEGVVGEQPILNPGESYEYTSGVPLTTPSGIMVGAYMMENDMGESFIVDIPPFSLDSPFDLHQIH